ncbi:hypothetical protein [Xanthobacter tagetidis]|uniref:Uncharacterized protein n=1 Tax=Xanthobacter tagetidis TaxID=60216 RepID=A0A3L7AJX2_9HYPH|nr:hypothetical protein [Xanthobacter tagetidis]MBB6308934.1 hypothetical protein [Xanthobacter tagetidis]RLP80557.1 hypothetical protein D9R14_05780 [Xanthobacter tagetidis]
MGKVSAPMHRQLGRREPSRRTIEVRAARPGAVEGADRHHARAAAKGSAALLAALVRAHGAPPPDTSGAAGEAG